MRILVIANQYMISRWKVIYDLRMTEIFMIWKWNHIYQIHSTWFVCRARINWWLIYWWEYMRHWIDWLFVDIMACHLLGVKSLPAPMLNYFWLVHWCNIPHRSWLRSTSICIIFCGTGTPMNNLNLSNTHQFWKPYKLYPGVYVWLKDIVHW